MEAINHFSDVTGLVANQEKSSIYLAGVGEVLQQKIIDSIGFTKGSLPIRYLGLPLSSKKWSKLDCHQLVDKITSRISNGYAKQL